MRDAFGEARQRLACEIDRHPKQALEPIAADPWIVSSLLQKSIRRGETGIAQRAALTFFTRKGSAIWRRFLVIAFEDIGAGSVDALAMTVAAATDPAWRKLSGGDARIAVALARILAEAAKDRSADYLGGAKDHPSFAAIGQTIATASLETRLSCVREKHLALPHRAIAALSAAGIGSSREKTANEGGLDALLAVYRALGAPDELVTATAIAAVRSREPITVLVPLIWLGANDGRAPTVGDRPVPPSPIIGDVPLYALDMHTRLGREAIWRFARENDALRACLELYVSPDRWRTAAYNAAFYVDASPVARQLIWEQSERLEEFGMEGDLQRAGVPLKGIAPLLQAMRTNLGHLNGLRAEALVRSQPAQAVIRASRR